MNIEFKRIDTNDSHQYYLSGVKLPGVTSILRSTKHPDEIDRLNKAIHAANKKNKAPIDINAARARGTATHTEIYKYFNGDRFNPSQRLLNFLPFLSQLKDSWVLCEEPVVNAESFFPYAGTVDLVAWHGKNLTVFDWTTSDRFYRKEWLKDKFAQCAAYTLALKSSYYGDEYSQITSISVAVLRSDRYQIFHEELEPWIKEWEFRLAIYSYAHEYHHELDLDWNTAIEKAYKKYE